MLEGWKSYKYGECLILGRSYCILDVLFLQYMTGKRLIRSALEELLVMYRGADKSLARPGRKQATATEDFDVHISYL